MIDELKPILERLELLNDTPEIIEGMQANRVDSNGSYNYWVGEAQLNLGAYHEIYEELKEVMKNEETKRKKL